MKKIKFMKRFVALLLALAMTFGVSTTALAYSSSCTVTVAPRTTAPGHISLGLFPGFSRTLSAKLDSGGLGSGEIVVLVVRESDNTTYRLVINSSSQGYETLLPVSNPRSGDYRVTVQNSTSVTARVTVKWI